ncbi:MAG TPA: Tad domain-containing protein [Candidatus Dormibacteraeota bacterium]
MGRRREEGQVLPLFAIAATVIVGIIALGIDYGFLTDQHRNLQAYVDEAAVAGAFQLPPGPGIDDYTRARTNAFIILRDNLGWNLSPGTGGSKAAATCAGTTMDPTSDINGCVLQPPYGNYTVSIQAPAPPAASGIAAAETTVAVQVVDAVATSFANVMGISSVNATAQAVAYNYEDVGGARATMPNSSGTTSVVGAAPFPYALWSDCIITGNHLEIVAGDVYVNQCGIGTQSGGLSGFCAEPTPESQPPEVGNIVLGPGVPQPLNLLTKATTATCTAAVAGQVISTGSVISAAVTMPAYPAPAVIPKTSCVFFFTCSPARADNACVNGSPGAATKLCYNPGTYSTIGVLPADTVGIQNNLNPGIYVLSGNNDSCYQSTSRTNCPAALFTGNTMNSNFSDVRDKCWASPANNPAQGTWGPGCPDGFAFDPTALTDPQCPAGLVALTAPAFALVPSATGASTGTGLDPNTGGTGTTYYVRVTALNGIGETTSNEVATLVNSTGNGKGTIAVTITNQAGATGYEIYGPSTSANGEKGYTTSIPTVKASGGLTTTFTLVTTQSGSSSYPLANTTVCSGMHNVPTSASQNYGVTFVLFNKASICLNTNCDATGTEAPTVLLAPYCGSGFTNYVCKNLSSYDGAFPIYGNSQGQVEANGPTARLGLTGTVYLPRGTIAVTSAQFEVIPGQVITHDFQVASSNLLNPDIYFATATRGGSNGTTGCTGGCVGSTNLAPLPFNVRLIQ